MLGDILVSCGLENICLHVSTVYLTVVNTKCNDIHDFRQRSIFINKSYLFPVLL